LFYSRTTFSQELMMKPILKALSVGIGALAIPAYIVYAQTTPSPTPATSSVPYIPLFVNGATSGTSTTGGTSTGATTWFIDVAGQQIVACTQAASGTGGAAPTITCNRQPIPPASGTGGTPTSGTTTTP
jgi:hypothetical protein